MSQIHTSNMFAIDRQYGAALITALLIMTILTILGITVMNMTSLEEKMAFNAQDRSVARYASESAVLMLADKDNLPELAPGNPGVDATDYPDLTSMIQGIDSGHAKITYLQSAPSQSLPAPNPKAGDLHAASTNPGESGGAKHVFEISATTTSPAGTAVQYRGGFYFQPANSMNE